MREHDVTALTAGELEAARRELAASLALARPGLPGSPRARPRTAGTRVEERRPGTQVPVRPRAWGRRPTRHPRDIRRRARSDGLCLWPSSGS